MVGHWVSLDAEWSSLTSVFFFWFLRTDPPLEQYLWMAMCPPLSTHNCSAFLQGDSEEWQVVLALVISSESLRADLWSSTSWRFVPFKDTVYVIPSSSARLRKQLDVFVSFLGELSLYFIMLYRQNLATVLTQNSARPGDLLWYAFQSHVIVAF